MDRAESPDLAEEEQGDNAVDAQVLQDYLDGGGTVITEYSNSAAMLNAAFDENVVLADGHGGCGDNVNPVTQLSPQDPFWLDNVFISEGVPGCGFDMAAYPGITPLGGWDAVTVSLAYRDRGAGRLWLVEADWQDNENGWSQASQSLMEYMVARGL